MGLQIEGVALGDESRPPNYSAHEELKLAFFCSDGQGGFRLQCHTKTNEVLVYPIDRPRLRMMIKAVMEHTLDLLQGNRR